MRRQVSVSKIAGLLDTTRGLSHNEAATRLAQHGSNAIVEKPPGGWTDVLHDTLKDPMLWFLAATGVLFAAIGDFAEAVLMLGAIAPLAGMDAFLHRRTQAATEGLRSRLAEQATVLRDGERVRIRAVDLVPGDLAVVGAGETFPADGLILAGDALQVDESALTGEAFPVPKTTLRMTQPVGNPTVDGAHWGFAGTRLLTGVAELRIVDTGVATVYGEIVRSAIHGQHAHTPLQRAIASLVATLLVAATMLCFALAWIRLRQGHGLVDALVSAVSLAVAAIPEEFPIVFAFFLGVGIVRLARRRALVRRAVVVENIGRVTYICSDKTGTLTEGRIVVAHVLTAAGVDRTRLMQIAALASRADSDDPLDAAILAAAASHEEYERLATFPFTENRRRETAVFRDRAGRTFVTTKGAPETVLDVCELPDAARQEWSDRVESLAAEGHKVIACAWLDVATGANLVAEPESDYLLAGLIACEDPVREGVVAAVREAQKAGIRVLMITGDHPATAAAVAREVGIGGGAPTVIDGDVLENDLPHAAPGRLLDVDVIARAVPAQKLSLVRTLQAQGEIVAVTGDGVNDVPALQAADVGIAMGERGTASARQVASIVLLDDNFRTIVSAIAEGRQLFRNLRASFAYLLMIHIPLVLTAMLVPLAGYPLLYLPIHVVWLELIIHPTALLVFQELPANAHLEPHAERDGSFFTPPEWLLIGSIGTAITLLIIWSYDRSLGTSSDVEHARTMALVLLVVASATLTLTLSATRNRTALTVALGTIGSALLLVETPVLAALLQLEPLHWDDWLVAAAGGIAPCLLAVLLRRRARR